MNKFSLPLKIELERKVRKKKYWEKYCNKCISKNSKYDKNETTGITEIKWKEELNNRTVKKSE